MVTLSDRFVVFAGVHLRTSAERRVYAAMASTPELEWTVAQLAATAQVSHHEADEALRRFVAAGIADRTGSGPRRRYRWSATMAYLTATGTPVSRDIDPVCGMPVDVEAKHVVEHGGDTIHFCSLPCLVLWRSNHRRDGSR